MSSPKWQSNRIGDITQSFIRRMTRECDRVGGINLGQGVCDLPTPPEILQATSEAILADDSMYSRFEGRPELRDTVADKLLRHNGIQVDPGSDLVITVGSAGAFHCVVQSLFDPGDEVLVFEPFYGYHVNVLRAGALRPVFVPLTAPDWELDFDRLESAVTARTRGIVVNTPANPSGKVFSREELEGLAAFCERHDLIVITDEIYEYIVYEAPHTSLASLPGMFERTVTISGFSKTFSITGWRLGYAAGPEAFCRRIGIANDLMYICAPTPLQVGLAKGMAALDDGYYTRLADEYRHKRDFFCGQLASFGLTPCVPRGAYYVLADVSGLGFDDDVAAAMHILETAGVACVPGSSFFASDGSTGLVRFCYAKETSVLEEACARLESAL